MTTITYKGLKNKARKQTVEPHADAYIVEEVSKHHQIRPIRVQRKAITHESATHKERANTHDRTKLTERARTQESTRFNERAIPHKSTTATERGPRSNKLRVALTKPKSQQQRIARLREIIAKEGPEKAIHEIEVLERKIADLRAALTPTEKDHDEVA